MRFREFTKGAVAGGAGAAVVLTATVAFAGSGIGGVFNLGQNNTVNETTGLTGSKAGAQLAVSNTSTGAGATGLSLTTTAGKPPLTVSNSTLNPKLNAQFLNGFAANGLGRVGVAATENLSGAASTNTQTTVTMAAPAKGFVRVDGRIIAYDGFSPSRCGDCVVYLRVKDDSSGAESPMTLFEGGNPASGTSETLYVSWVFPVTPGTRSFSLQTAQTNFSGGPFGLYNPVLVAQYVPYGAAGTPTARSAPAPGRSLRGAKATVRRAPKG